eukprot:1255124-Pleurochrysis_carterae.AAC.1
MHGAAPRRADGADSDVRRATKVVTELRRREMRNCDENGTGFAAGNARRTHKTRANDQMSNRGARRLPNSVKSQQALHPTPAAPKLHM